MTKDNETVSIEIGWVPLLAIFAVLLALKTSGLVDWSWWIITAPIWFLPALIFAFIATVFVFVAAVLVVAVPFAVIASISPSRRR